LTSDNEMVRDILLVGSDTPSDLIEAGMARAKAAGKYVGRPSLNITGP
jgi:hypothetical protein